MLAATVATGLLVAGIMLAADAPANAAPPPTNVSTISQVNGVSTAGTGIYAPLIVAPPLLTLSGTTNFPLSLTTTPDSLWQLVLRAGPIRGGGGSSYVANSTPLYCSNTPWTDPASGLGEYGAPPVAADGSWVCDVAADPNAATDGFHFFDPATLPAINPEWAVSIGWGDNGCAVKPAGCTDINVSYFAFGDPVVVPILSWQGGVISAGVAGLAAVVGVLVWRRRRRALGVAVGAV